MTNTTTPSARVETIPAVMAGDVITVKGTDYYIEEVRGSTLAMVRLHDLAEGFTFPLRGAIESRRATEEERGRVYAALLAKAEAEAAFRPGALVRVTANSKHADPNALYVILKSNAKSVSIIELGGHAHHHPLTAGRGALAIVDPADVLK